LPALFCGVLFQLGDAAVQTVDIVGGPEAGLSPRLFTEMLGKTLAELGVFARQTGDAVMSVGQVGNEGWPTDARSSGPGGGRFGGFDGLSVLRGGSRRRSERGAWSSL
jgi:hypothetical protein